MKPRTIEEAMDAFPKIMSGDDLMDLVTSDKEDLITYHHDLGRWIRNNWGLWEQGPLFGFMKALGFKHPDDMSQALIHEYWTRMNKLPSVLQEDMDRANEHWKREGIDEPCGPIE